MKFILVNVVFAFSYFALAALTHLEYIQGSFLLEACFAICVMFFCLTHLEWRMKKIEDQTKHFITHVLIGAAIFSVILFPYLLLDKFEILQGTANHSLLLIELGIITTVNGLTIPKELKKINDF